MSKQLSFEEFTFGRNFQGDFLPPLSTFWTPKRYNLILHLCKFEIFPTNRRDLSCRRQCWRWRTGTDEQSSPERTGNIPSKSMEYSNGVR
ncbi:hypothetical protein D8674_041626 [Pyrus ussuriensis x Pyrus communis]|uniref:Uncharacterized protein n=1 Tax=Pyrus ussuriensis x Pyrus communis TaxID=2448454 RepID=A0A5N5HB02_9ROSA|nr:hypothetical protein D8674_041626 [Pyrus ussuriensis x Pyrus communis]